MSTKPIMRYNPRAIVTGSVLIVAGAILAPFIGLLSLFISMPIIILGTCVVTFGSLRLKFHKTVIFITSILISYYAILHTIATNSQALT